MKKLLAFSFLSLLVSALYAQSGQVIKDENAQVRNVSGFHAIRISGGIDLYLTQGSEAVAVSASNPDYRDKIKTVVEDGVLKIYLENTGAHIIWGWKNPRLRAYVSADQLDNIKASGGSDVFIDGVIKSPKLVINISGGSDLKGEFDVVQLELTQSGGSDAEISGSAQQVKVDASGGSDLKAYACKMDICDVSASGGSDIQITVNKELTANASGGSDIYYQGEGVIRNLRSSGSSSVKKRG